MRLRLFFATVLLTGLVPVLSFASPRLDPAKVVGADDCQKCHESEVTVWEGTHHHKTYKELHKREAAKKIAKNLGISRIKSDETCMGCHYTVQDARGKQKAVSGISCESCHGAAKSWIKLHNDYGSPKATKASESPEHRKKRFAKAEAAGMIRPDELYKIAENCYQCHTVPNEKLVNVGGHKPGSDFELVKWSQGEVRHNFASSGGKGNQKASAERKRMFYVVGQALDLEYALRGVAQSTKKADYAVKMAKRAAASKKRFKQILAKAPDPEIKAIFAAADGAKLKLNNGAALSKAADSVGAATRKFIAKHDGSQLAGIDALLPKSYKGKPAA